MKLRRAPVSLRSEVLSSKLFPGDARFPLSSTPASK
jgi:hypothetical protein